MQRLLIGAILACLLAGSALADSTVHGLATNATSPLPVASCLYVDQASTTDAKLCSNWAVALGAVANPSAVQIQSTYVNASVIGAAVAAAGTGVIPGATVLTATGGTGTEPTFTVTNSKAVSATVANAGDGSGTPGSATVTTTTATGTQAQFTVTIDGAGLLASVDAVLAAGDLTVDFTDPTAEPVTGGSLVGAQLNIVEGALVASITTAGSLTAVANNPVSTTGGNDDVTLNLSLSFAPSIVGSDVASGFGFDINGFPQLKSLDAAVVSVAASTNSQVLVLDGNHAGILDNNVFLTILSANDNAVTLRVDGLQDFNGLNVNVQDGSVFRIRNHAGSNIWLQVSPSSENTQDSVSIRTSDAGSHLPTAFANSDGGFSFNTDLVVDVNGNTNILNGGLVVGTPTGGSQGAGTVNADGYYAGGTAGVASCTAAALGATVTIKAGLITAFTGC